MRFSAFPSAASLRFHTSFFPAFHLKRSSLRSVSSVTATADGGASYVRGPTSVPLLRSTLGDALRDAASRWGTRPALIAPAHGVRWSWAELDERVSAAAAGLLRLGLAPGDRVACWALNCPEWTVTQLAAARAGLIFVTVNPAYRTHELEYALRHVGAAALVTATSFKTSNFLAMLRELMPEVDTCARGALHAARLPALRVVVQLPPSGEGSAAPPPAASWCAPGAVAWGDLVALGTAAPHTELSAVRPSEKDTCVIQFTSGTTGSPKGVMLSHSAVLNNGSFAGRAQGLGPEDVLALPVPLFHCFGSVLGTCAQLALGTAVVYPSEAFDARAMLAAIERERCTAVYGVPTMFIAALALPDFARYRIASLRTGVMAGSICPASLMRELAERMNLAELTIAYGMTETAPVSFQTAPTDTPERRAATIGQVHPHVECKVIDASGATVPRGVRGELCTRGYSVMEGYWAEPEKTAAVIDAEGWMHTGDLATIDADGYGSIVGRIKDLVIRGGENIAPREVEDFLRLAPGVEDVQVFGVADALYGEELCAWVRVKEGARVSPDMLRAFCTGKIAAFKVPRYIELVDAFPMTVSGKAQKFLMRADVEQRLARGAALGAPQGGTQAAAARQ